MGLDISYANKINFESRGYVSDDADNKVYLYPNDSILNQSEGILSGEYESFGMHGSFRAGSYSGYSTWRRTLAAMIGWSNLQELWTKVETLVQRNESLNDVLNENDDVSINIPFIELLNFSDCEGFIGPKTSAKLRADFLEWDERAKNFEAGDSYFYRLYKEWSNAFNVASDGGCVMFH
jgi:hypothetical protein